MNDSELRETSPQPHEQPGSPLAVEPEEPRLGIIHLLAWTAGVAVYLSLFRTVIENDPDGVSSTNKALWIINGFAGGAALAGLGLLVARFRRGVRFPKHPGEYLLVMIGLQTVCGLVFQFYWFLSQSAEAVFDSSIMISFMILYTSITVVGATVCTIAARQVQMHRWKVFFLISILVHLAMGLLRCADLLIFSGTYGISQALGLALNFVLLVVVAMDALKRKPYPWPHFLGVVLCFWQVLFGLVCYVIFSWFPEML